MNNKQMILSAKTYEELKSNFVNSWISDYTRPLPADAWYEGFIYGDVEFIRGKTHTPLKQYAIKPLEDYLDENKAVVSTCEVLEVPHNILQKAEEVSLWFAERGIDEWQVGKIQSRR